jgi:hypothetical protein
VTHCYLHCSPELRTLVKGACCREVAAARSGIPICGTCSLAHLPEPAAPDLEVDFEITDRIFDSVQWPKLPVRRG